MPRTQFKQLHITHDIEALVTRENKKFNNSNIIKLELSTAKRLFCKECQKSNKARLILRKGNFFTQHPGNLHPIDLCGSISQEIKKKHNYYLVLFDDFSDCTI
jgi:hypothetical protein